MDDGPQRVEIELTDAAPSRSRFARRRGAPTSTAAPSPVLTPASSDDWSPPEGAVVVTGDAPPSPGDGSTDGRRVVAIAAAVGTFALVAGWALGRSGGDGSAQSVDVTTSAASASDAGPGTTVLPGESIAPAELPTTTRLRPSTTTTVPPEWTIEQISVDPRLAGSTDTLVAIGSPGHLVELDLSTGERRSLELSGMYSPNIYVVTAGNDWVMYTDGNTGSAWILRGDDTVPERTSLSTDGGALWQPGTDLFWRMEPSGAFGPTLEEVDLDGSPTGRTIETPDFWPSMIDVDGSVIVGDGVFGAYVVSPDGSFRLPGGVLALGDAGWLVRLCGDTIDSCGPAMVDRATLDVRPLPVDPDGRRIEPSFWYGGSGTRPAISPDGRRALVYVTDDQGVTTSATLDLTTGAVTEVPGPLSSYFSMSWSSDGRFVFLLGGGAPSAWDVEVGEVFPIAPGLGVMSIMTVRPAPPADDG